jgi:hypothetical protein
MKMLVGTLAVGALIAASAFMQDADAQQFRKPRPDDPERLRMIRECMEMHHKHRADNPWHSGGHQRLYRACMAKHGHHG